MEKQVIKEKVDSLYEKYNELTRVQSDFMMKRGQFEDEMKAFIKDLGKQEQGHMIEIFKELVGD